MEFLTTLWDTIGSVPWFGIYLLVKYIFIALSIIIGAAFLILLPIAWNYGKVTFRWRNDPDSIGESPADVEHIGHKWEELMRKAEAAPPASLIQAISEADNLLDAALRQMGIPGDNLSARLEHFNPENAPSLERVWRAHSIKNNLVNMPDYQISEKEAQTILGDYEAFFKELGIL